MRAMIPVSASWPPIKRWPSAVGCSKHCWRTLVCVLCCGRSFGLLKGTPNPCTRDLPSAGLG